jgi:hypothetical protein
MVELARHAESIGADAVLVVSPFYWKVGEEALFRHFAAVAESVSIPVLVYNLPMLTGIDLSPSLIARIPRLGLFIIWVARPALVDAAFNTFILPLLGIIFLPFATLIYVVLYVPGVGLSGWGWFWVILAALFDIGHWGPATPNATRSLGRRAGESQESGASPRVYSPTFR